MMLNFSDILQNPVTMPIAAAVLVLVILTAIVFSIVLGRQRRGLEQLRDISDSLSHLQDSFVRT
ncbi:MAG: hypothetical protein ACPH3B_08045, partial [Candidatus Puniceispirillaceae bacterium]